MPRVTAMQEQTKPQPVRLVEGKGSMSMTFHLTPFITEWEKAKELFISHVAREIDPNLRPSDVTSSLSIDMSESWCKCRVFRGTLIATLRSDSLEFDVPRPFAGAYRAEADMIVQAAENLLASLDYGNYAFSSFYGAHVEAVQGSSEQYLARFAHGEVDPATDAQSGMRYRPSAVFLFRNDDGSRMLRKTFELSEIIPNGLFVTTYVRASKNEEENLEEQLNWVTRVDSISDRAAGIAYVKDTADAEMDS